jgi:transcription termination/antitermination protein NusG
VIASTHEPRVEPVSWFAAWTRSRHEAAVLRQLEQKELEAFLPTSARWSRWKDRKKRIDFPLFPGYCFVRVAPDTLPAVRKCTGVVSIVSTEGRPAAIPDREIEGVRAFIASHLEGDPCPLLQEGDSVEVTSGPLRGVVGKLVRKGSQARLILSVGLLGQGISVAVDAADIRPY